MKRKLLILIRIIDRIIDDCIAIVLIIIVLFGIYAASDLYSMYNLAAVQSERHRYTEDGEEKQETKPYLDSKVGYITIDGTSIDYPVMQGENNLTFLNTDPYGDYSVLGSIFMDCRNRPDFSDQYSLLYGHHMEYGVMFGALDKYLKDGYLMKHPYGTLTIDRTGEKKKIVLFAVMEAPATNKAVFAPTENDDMNIKYIKQHALFYFPENKPEKGDTILALSTCKFPDSADRTIVFGALKQS